MVVRSEVTNFIKFSFWTDIKQDIRLDVEDSGKIVIFLE